MSIIIKKITSGLKRNWNNIVIGISLLILLGTFGFLMWIPQYITDKNIVSSYGTWMGALFTFMNVIVFYLMNNKMLYLNKIQNEDLLDLQTKFHNQQIENQKKLLLFELRKREIERLSDIIKLPYIQYSVSKYSVSRELFIAAGNEIDRFIVISEMLYKDYPLDSFKSFKKTNQRIIDILNISNDRNSVIESNDPESLVVR
jgi:hypothetical protein